MKTPTASSPGPHEADASDDRVRDAITWLELEALLSDMEALHTKKVLDLARRLKPGLTMEDVKNPHDFPELSDPDWHYEDGILTGIQAVRAALSHARKRDLGPNPLSGEEPAR